MSSKEWISFQRAEMRMGKIEKIFKDHFEYVDYWGNVVNFCDMDKYNFYEVRQRKCNK
jgi:hypothetical protein